MNIKVIIYDGIVHEVLTTEPAEVEIVNIDRDYEDYEALCSYEQELYQDPALKSRPFTVARFDGEEPS